MPNSPTTTFQLPQPLADWNATARSYPRDRLIHELFSDQAGRTPEAIAVEFGGQRLSYRELDLQSDVAAERLNACGVGPGDLVGLCADRSLELIVALLGILKAGAAYVPLDSRLPQERLRQMVEDAGLRLILVAEADRQRIESVLELLGLEPGELVTDGLSEEPVTPSPCPLPRSGGEGSDAFEISTPWVDSGGIRQNSQSRVESSGIGQKSHWSGNSGESHYSILTNCGSASLRGNCQTKTLEELVASENGLSSAAEDRQDNHQDDDRGTCPDSHQDTCLVNDQGNDPDNDRNSHQVPQQAERHLAQRATAEHNLQSQSLAKSQLASARQMTADQWPAYVNYTSGSTGQPRGVLIPHRAVVRLVLGCNYVNLDGQETILHHSTLSFDASTFEIWGALLSGGRLVLMAPGQATLSEFGQVIREHGVTTLWLTAGLFHLMVDNRLEDLRPLRQLLAGGDVLSPSHVARVRRELPSCRLINGYGPTENTTFTCCYTVAEDYEESRSVPIGRPISNTRVYVLDLQMQPVPVGVVGELYAGGDGLAIGYLNQPELTAEKFVSDPFSAEAGARLYRTGDLARWRADGNLEFLGRIDHQVKIRGFRIELGEIESTLCRHEAIAACVVQAVKGVAGENSLVAYVVPRDVAMRDGKDPLVQPLVTSHLRSWLAERLPEYMLPTRFVSLPQLPLNSSGKVDRRRLKELCDTGAACVEPTRAPKPDTGLEAELAEIWQRLLRRDSIGPEDNFFDLGGHSLLAARLAAEIETNLGCHLRIDEIFRFQSIRTLAGRISGEDRQIIGRHIVPIQPSGDRPPLFCFHGFGGTAAHFAHLARHLGAGIPVYGLQAAGVDGKSDRHSTVEEMARHYAREIRSLTPRGPYYFTGHSIGGWIAFATALEIELETPGQCTLCLLDTQDNARVAGLRGVRQRSMILSNNIRGKFKRWLDMPANDKLSAVGRHVRHSASLMTKLHLRLGNGSQRPSHEQWTLLEDVQKLGQSRTKDYYVQSVERYTPSHRVQDFRGDILVVVGTDQLHFPHQQFWTSMTRGRVEVQIVQADHLSMMHRDESRHVAQHLRKLWPE